MGNDFCTWNEEIVGQLVKQNYTKEECIFASSLWCVNHNKLDSIKNKLKELKKDPVSQNSMKISFLIFGYIRENYNNLNNSNIPKDILSLCIKFYSMPTQKFILSRKKKNKNLKTDILSLQISDKNINIKHIISGSTYSNNDRDYSISTPFCYIPNPSLFSNLHRPKPLPQKHKWICPFCTTQNDYIWDGNCSMCKSKRPCKDKLIVIDLNEELNNQYKNMVKMDEDPNYDHCFFGTTYKSGSMPGLAPLIVFIDNISHKNKLKHFMNKTGKYSDQENSGKNVVKYLYCSNNKEIVCEILEQGGMQSVNMPVNQYGRKLKTYKARRSCLYSVKPDNFYKNGYIMQKLINPKSNKEEKDKLCNFWGVRVDGHYLAMDYLSSTNCIFALECFSGNPWSHSGESPYLNTDTWTNKWGAVNISNNELEYRKCAIFDLNENKWKEIKSFEYSLNNKSFAMQIPDERGTPEVAQVIHFKCGITKDFNEKNIYLLSDIGITSLYNFEKNKWIKLCDDQPINNKDISIWFDSYDHNVLYAALFKKYEPPIFQYLDIRDSKLKWNEIKYANKEYAEILKRKLIDIF
eukprot:167009_1